MPTATIKTVYQLQQNGVNVGAPYPTLAAAEAAVLADPTGTYYIATLVQDTTTAGSSPASPSGTVVEAGSAGSLTDSAGNVYTITAGAQIAVNGAIDVTTANVTAIGYFVSAAGVPAGPALWQINAAGAQYHEPVPKTAAGGGWVQSPTGPLSGGTTPPPGGSFKIYDDGDFAFLPANGGEGGDYNNQATTDYNATGGDPPEGTEDILVTITGAWGEWLPYYHQNPGPFLDLATACGGAQANNLVFWFKPLIPNQTLNVYLVFAGDEQPPAANIVNPFQTKYGPAPEVGVYAKYVIPLSDLGVGPNNMPGGNQFYKMAIHSQTGNDSEQWRVTGVYLTT